MIRNFQYDLTVDGISSDGENILNVIHTWVTSFSDDPLPAFSSSLLAE